MPTLSSDDDNRRKDRQALVRASKQMLAVARMSGLEGNGNVHVRFRFFSFRKERLTKLTDCLRDRYTCAITYCDIANVWTAVCNTCPHSVKMTEPLLLDLVYAMLEITLNSECGLRSWSVIDPVTEQEFSTATFW